MSAISRGHSLTLLHQLVIFQRRNIFTTACALTQNMRIRSHNEIINQPVASVPVIQFPQRMAAKMGKALELKKQHDDRVRAEKWANLKKRVLIQSSRKDRVFYAGQSTNPLDGPKLASLHWTGRKAVGDHFIIKPRGDNPAMRDCQTDDVPGFEKFQLDQRLMDAIEDMEFAVCTNIQNQAIPPILHGENVLLNAETGSGKTLAYLLPLLHKLILQHTSKTEAASPYTSIPVNSPSAIILVPSRELAQQVYDVTVKLLSYSALNPALVVGGERTQLKLNRPHYNVMDVLISTPGVLSKLVSNRIYKLNLVNTVVIDEADTLVDDSFCEVVRRILSKVHLRSNSDNRGADGTPPSESDGAQLILAAATLPRSLNDTLEGLLPVEDITRIRTQYLHRVMPHVKQTFHRTKPSDRPQMVLKLVKESLELGQILMIFCHDAATCDWLVRFLQENGVNTSQLNGALRQRIRRGRFEQFQRGDFRCLVCTDIASRGLDTINVNHVINYNFPTVVSDYIHRCGRTGRVGAPSRGEVTSFVTYPDEALVVQKIETAVRAAREYNNVNANISRRINRQHGQTDEDRKALREAHIQNL